MSSKKLKYLNEKNSTKKPTSFHHDNYGKEERAEPYNIAISLKNYKFPNSIFDMTSRDFQLDTNAHIDVLSNLLKDEVYLNCFRDAILFNRHLFRNRVVLDISCGIGLLSLFAAKAGARSVYAIESSNIVDYFQQIVIDNNYSDVIHIIKGDIENVELPVASVDIIVCNWIGYSLLYESMCDAVIFARDKWLRKDKGLIFPDVAKLYIAAVEDYEQKNNHIEWWKDVYGFPMNCLRERALLEPIYTTVQPSQIISYDYCIKKLNLYTATLNDLPFKSKFLLEMKSNGKMHGVVTYFKVYFSQTHIPLCLSTDPSSRPTHWCQTLYFFDKSIDVNTDDVFYGGIEMSSINRKKYNSKNMQIAFEMFSGEPQEMCLETVMRWVLKPNSLVMEKTNFDNSIQIANG